MALGFGFSFPSTYGVTAAPIPVYYSVAFDGTGDYLNTPADVAFDFGTGDWTVETWFYIANNSSANSSGNRDGSLFSINSGGPISGFNLTIQGNGSTTGTGIQLFKSTNTQVSITRAVTISQQVWHHIAVTKSSGIIRIFFNGVQQGANAVDNTLWGFSTLLGVIGRQGWPGYVQEFNGKISNIRVVKGTAVYTSNFTPPTSPLTAITNTVLLTCKSSTFVDESANNFTITNVGNAAISTDSPFN